MFSDDEKLKIYNLIKVYEKVGGFSYIGGNMIMERHNFLQWNFEEFMSFLLKNHYITKINYDTIQRAYKNGKFSYSEESIISLILPNKEDIFDIWYIEYISNKKIKFSMFYEELYTGILKDIPIEKSYFEHDLIKYSEEKKGLKFKDLKNFPIGVFIEENKLYILFEYLEALENICTDKLELQIVNEMKNVFEDIKKEM